MAICNNKKCSLGECDQSETCAAYVPVITNADRIRSLSDEELAKILGDKCICPPAGECAKMSGDCAACWLEWLQQPAERG